MFDCLFSAREVWVSSFCETPISWCSLRYSSRRHGPKPCEIHRSGFCGVGLVLPRFLLKVVPRVLLVNFSGYEPRIGVSTANGIQDVASLRTANPESPLSLNWKICLK